MGYADLHIHTTYSWDAASSVKAIIKYAARHTLLDVIAITDHDRIDGAREALELSAEYDLDVIPGIEISTKEGHLLALFVTNLIPPGLSLEETVLRTVDQGGLCIVPHPMMASRMGINPHAVRRALLNPRVAQGLRGIEMFNGGFAGAQRDPLAISIANWLPLAKVGCSDAHVNFAIGMGATRFPGDSAAELRHALENRQTQAVGKRELHWFEFTTRYIPRLILRYVSWGAWNSAFLKPLQSAE